MVDTDVSKRLWDIANKLWANTGLKDVSPPHKYLSGSHLNCIGIAFFLASAEAFNKKNKFLVIS